MTTQNRTPLCRINTRTLTAGALSWLLCFAFLLPPVYSENVPQAGALPPAAGNVRQTATTPSNLQNTTVPSDAAEAEIPSSDYRVGVNDVLDISILRPEEFTMRTIVSPDGFISFPYIGSVFVKGMNLPDMQQKIQDQLADGYLRYPVVSVTLVESRSRYFFVYGEVQTPGAYVMEDNMSVFKALAVAGGFTKFGASSRVKILRPKAGGPGYDTFKVNLKDILDGVKNADVILHSGDVIVVSEGIF